MQGRNKPAAISSSQNLIAQGRGTTLNGPMPQQSGNGPVHNGYHDRTQYLNSASPQSVAPGKAPSRGIYSQGAAPLLPSQQLTYQTNYQGRYPTSIPYSSSSSNAYYANASQQQPTGNVNANTSASGFQEAQLQPAPVMDSESGVISSNYGASQTGGSNEISQPVAAMESAHPVIAGKRRHYPKQVAPSIPTVSKSAASAAASGNAMAMPTMQQSRYVQSPSSINADQATFPGGTFPGQQPKTDSAQRSAGQSPTPLSGPYNKDMSQLNSSFGRLTVEQANAFPINLMDQRSIVPATPVEPPRPPLPQDLQKKNVDPGIFRITLNSMPQTSSLLSKSRLPLGIHIQPYKDVSHIPVITSSVITRCRICRTYINPFVTIVDHRRWQCNLCYRINDLPEELSYDHQTRGYIDPRRRPELNSASVEFVAPSEYMLRPPQPAVFLFVLDASSNAIETGYLRRVCALIKENLENLPGDARTLIGFITFNSSIHFYSLKTSQPQMLIVSDLDDVFIPTPDGLLANLKENKDIITQALDVIPQSFVDRSDMNSATGAAMQAARKLLQSTGGRITLFQTCLPSVGPGKLAKREAGNVQGNSKDSQLLGPSTDFYKKMALDCAGDQIAIDLFLLSSQYSDLASLSCASRYSSGCVYYFQDFHSTKNPGLTDKFDNDFRHYLTRKIGFEAVMRVRCTKGLAIHTFHGNCFVRSTDLLSLPNVNPDHSFTLQIAIEDALSDTSVAAFQAALLYTTSKGERRIRVHTLAVPITTKLSDVFAYADQQAIVGLLGKMAVDRTLMSCLGDAREALMNACQDCLSVYRAEVAGQKSSGNVLSPQSLRLIPLYTLSLLKYEGFRLGSGVSLDARCFAMMQMKTLPLEDIMVHVYPRLYQVSDLADESVSRPIPILNCSAERYNRQAVYLLDVGKALYIFLGKSVHNWLVQQLLNIPSYGEIPENMHILPDLDTHLCKETRGLIQDIRSDRAHYPLLKVIREESRQRVLFIGSLMDDRSESVMSYQEFLLHLQRQLNK